MNPSSSIILAVVAPAAFALGWGCFVALRARRSAGWPVVPATITESRVVQQGNARSPRLAFDYAVAAERRVGRRLWVGPRSIAVTGPWADRVAARYPVGAVVRVAVDPADPAYAVLEPGLRMLHWLPVAFGLLVTVVGLLLAVAI